MVRSGISSGPVKAPPGATRSLSPRRFRARLGPCVANCSGAARPSRNLRIRREAKKKEIPSIPGPDTLGPENYSRVSRAFLEHGWAAFEEEFDSIVPRTRTDYTDVKRDLLREPIFDIKPHRNLADLALGTKTFDEIVAEIQSEQAHQKPQ